jgi:hypothetical protein
MKILSTTLPVSLLNMNGKCKWFAAGVDSVTNWAEAMYAPVQSMKAATLDEYKAAIRGKEMR